MFCDIDFIFLFLQTKVDMHEVVIDNTAKGQR